YPPGAAAAHQHVEHHLGERAGQVSAGLDGLAVGADRRTADLGQGDTRRGREDPDQLEARRRAAAALLLQAQVDRVQRLRAVNDGAERAAPQEVGGEVAVRDV